MSSPVHPETAKPGAALHELEQLVHSMGEELASFRKRAQSAEARVKTLESSPHGGDLFGDQRLHVLEEENNALRARMQHATERIRVLLAQLRFLRQQREQAVQAMSIAEQ
ncbi:MAG TPA: hypothetical protein VJ717_12615 [Gemmatimonadaceae bacterium]|nr:hypothetical protein [Gemmatimonadaceae bacterium]